MTDLHGIKSAITSSYHSLDNPNFFFVGEAAQRKPFAKLIERLAELVSVSDETDPNNDHCQTLVLREAGKSWSLQLSYVGLYAVLFRLGRQRPSIVASGNEVSLTDTERRIADELVGEGFTFLTQPILETPIALKLFCADRGNVCYYQALFSDTDVLPWKA